METTFICLPYAPTLSPAVLGRPVQARRCYGLFWGSAVAEAPCRAAPRQVMYQGLCACWTFAGPDCSERTWGQTARARASLEHEISDRLVDCCGYLFFSRVLFTMGSHHPVCPPPTPFWLSGHPVPVEVKSCFQDACPPMPGPLLPSPPPLSQYGDRSVRCTPLHSPSHLREGRGAFH